MIEKHIYQCEVCGKTFDDENECHAHEMEHELSFIKNAVVIMDDGGEVLSLDDMHIVMAKSYAIYVGCEEAAKMLWGLFKKEGYLYPLEDIDAPIQYPAFFIWDQNTYDWLYMHDLEKKYNRLLELKATAENALLQ